MRPSALALFVLLSVGACKDKAADKPVAVDAAAAGATATSGPGAELPLDQQLARESANRPSIPVTADTVFGAIAAAGFEVIEPKQVLGTVVNANYCRNSRVPAYGIIAVVCEYPSPEAAKKGRELSMTRFKTVKNREVFVNGSTTLAMVTNRDLPSRDEWGKKIIDIFQKLPSR